MAHVSHTSGIVLAGGKSRRMGRDKRHLSWEGERLLDSICRLMGELFSEVIMVTAVPDYDVQGLPVRIVTDEIPGSGSIGGLYTGIMHAGNPHCFVVACDMPYLKKDVIIRLCEMNPIADIVVVRLLQGIQPLHGRYSKRCLPVIGEMIHSGMFSIQGILQDSRLISIIVEEGDVRDLDPHLQTFMNVNTPSDWELARKIKKDQNDGRE
jgi:molybdenum cofactor guanylyltransferase